MNGMQVPGCTSACQHKYSHALPDAKPKEDIAKTHLEPEGYACQQCINSEVNALLHGAVQADAGPVALPTQHWGNDELEAIRAARLQLAAAQQLTRLFRLAADGVLCWVSCKLFRKY